MEDAIISAAELQTIQHNNQPTLNHLTINRKPHNQPTNKYTTSHYHHHIIHSTTQSANNHHIPQKSRFHELNARNAGKQSEKMSHV